MKDDIHELKREENTEYRVPPDHIVTCNICNWKGKIKDCPIEMDSEGWEYPEYEVLLCPNCGENDIYV